MNEEKQKNNNASDLVDVGAFWKKEKNGKQFLSGKVKIRDGEYTAFLFKNNKTKPNQPDYRLAVSDLPDELVPSSQKSAPAKAAQAETEEVQTHDDIPF